MLSHPLWQKTRLEVLDRDGWKCRKCGCDYKRLEVHHTRYFRKRIKPWEYPRRFLISLCTDCHENETLKQRSRRKRFFRAFWRRVR